MTHFDSQRVTAEMFVTGPQALNPAQVSQILNANARGIDPRQPRLYTVPGGRGGK